MSEESTPRQLFCQEDLCSLKLAGTEVMEAEECLVPGVPTPTRPSIWLGVLGAGSNQCAIR